MTEQKSITMRDLFPSYYRPTDEEFKELWEKCTFIFDANVLLNLYLYDLTHKIGLIVGTILYVDDNPLSGSYFTELARIEPYYS